MTVKHGQPKVGRKNARKMTRAECELTDLPRWVKIYTSPATGETAFKNLRTQILSVVQRLFILSGRNFLSFGDRI